MRLSHELSRDAALAVGTKNGERCNVAMRRGGVLLHLRQHIPYDLSLVVLSHVDELRPREKVVEVVLELVAEQTRWNMVRTARKMKEKSAINLLLRETPQIRGLDLNQIISCCLPYAHHT
jgi:hypothetical protein